MGTLLRRFIAPVLTLACTLGCQVTMSELQALNPHASTLEVPCRPGVIPDGVHLMAVQSGSGHIVTDEQPSELQSIAPLASVFIEFKDGAPEENARIMASEYGLSCPNQSMHSGAPMESFRDNPPPDVRFMGDTVAPAAGSLPRVGVCARPPGITVNEWVGGAIGIKGAKTTMDEKDYAERATKASVIFYFDPNAVPESVWNFGPDTQARCPGKKAPMPFDQYMASRNASGSQAGGATTASSSKSSPNGKGPPLSVFETIANNLAIAGALAQGDTSGRLDHPEGSRSGIPGGQNVGGFSFPPLQAGVALLQILSSANLSPKSFIDDIVKIGKRGQRTLIKEADAKVMQVADELIQKHGRYEMAKGLEEMQTIMPFELGQKFTAELGGKFQAHKIFELRAFEHFGIDGWKKAPSVILTDIEHQKITAALAAEWTKIGPRKMTKAKLREIYKTIYADHPQWLEAIESYLR